MSFWWYFTDDNDDDAIQIQSKRNKRTTAGEISAIRHITTYTCENSTVEPGRKKNTKKLNKQTTLTLIF